MSDLTPNTPFKIVAAKLVKGKFKKQILLELEENVVFLPDRVTEVYTPFITEFISKKYSIVFRELIDIGFHHPATTFEIIED